MSKKDDYELEFEHNDAEFEIKRLKKKLLESETMNQRMKQVIVDNELEGEIEGLSTTTDAEQICVKGISQILELVEKSLQTDSDVKNFDILYKNLRLIRGQDVPKGKGKKLKTTDVGELISIVKGK